MANDPHEYSADDLHPTAWGICTELGDGGWETIWRLTFTAPQPRRSIPVYDNGAGFRATLETTGGTGGVLRVLTREDAMAAKNYPLTFTSFGIVNDSVAEIREIQDRPRDWYAPFRNRPPGHRPPVRADRPDGRR